MPDPTPAEQVRAEAIERMARADYTDWLERVRETSYRWREECEHQPWDQQPDEGQWGRNHWRRIHARNVDAIADLLRTEETAEPVGYVVLAKGVVLRPGVHECNVIGSVRHEREHADHQRAHCEALAEENPEYAPSGGFAVAELRMVPDA